MAKGISLSVVSDTRAFTSGIKSGVVDPLENVSDVLQDVAKDGDKAGDNLERSMRDAQKDTDRLGKEYEDLNRKIREAGQGGRGFGPDMRRGTDEAGEAVQEWGDEAKQNISETFSSFRGEAEDFVGIVQDTFGGVISNLGPIGMAAGAAGALGIGLLMGEFERAKEREQEFREQVGQLASELIEIGGDPADAVRRIANGLKELVNNSEEGELTLAGLREAAESSASGFRKIADAYAGNTDELEKLIESEKERLEAAEDAYNFDKRWDSATTERLKKARDGQRDIVEGLEETRKVTEQAAAEEEAWLSSSGPWYEARADQMEALQDELDEAIGSWSDYQDAETGATDPGAYLEAMRARMDATSNFNSNVQILSEQFGLTFEETQAILDQGVDFAPMLQSILDSGMGEEYASQIRSMLDGGQAILDGAEMTAQVTTSTDTSNAEQQLDAAATERTAPIEAEPDTKTAEKNLDDVAAKKRTAKITASVSTADAEAALQRFIDKQRTTVITVETRDREGRLVP